MWKRNSWSLGIIFLFFLFSLTLVQAQNITLVYKNEVNVNEEFDVILGIIDFPEDIYDIKIDITVGNERIGRIFDPSLNKYKSTVYYVNDILNTNECKDFKMKITKEYEGEANITIKIRDFSKNKIEVFEGFTININLQEILEKNNSEEKVKQLAECFSNIKAEQDAKIKQAEDETNAEPNDEGNNSESNEKVNNTDNEGKNSEEINNKSINKGIKELTTETNENEVIFLTPQSIKNPESKEIIFRSKNERTRNYAIYGFAVFLVLIIILLILDRRQSF